MAQSVVSCSSCGKKFRVPDGAGDFDCTGCGELVQVGGGSGGGRSRSPGVRERRRSAQSRRGGSNKGLVIGLVGLGCVLVVVVVLVFAMGGPDKSDAGSGMPDETSNRPPENTGPRDPAPGNTDVTDPAPGGTNINQPPPPDKPEPEPEKPKPEPEPEPEPSQDIHYMQWGELSKVMKELEPAEGTSPSDVTKITKMVALVMDFQSGRDGQDAMYDLIKIGKPAVPMLLKAVAGLTFVDIPDRSAGALVDQALRGITNYTRQMELKPVIEKPGLYKRVFKYHFIWWEEHKHLEGDKFKEKSRDTGMDDDDEDW